MFAKVACVLVAIGACGCSLLALRQQRLQVASELTRAQLRIQAADERLWELRAQIAARTTPEQIRELAVGIGAMKPLISTPTDMPDQWRFAEGGGEVLPIVPRLNEPAGAPVSRVRQTPAPTRTTLASRTPPRREAATASRTNTQPAARTSASRSEPTQVVQRTRNTRQTPSASSGTSRRSAPPSQQATPSRSNRRDASETRETPAASGTRTSRPTSRPTARPSTSPARVARTDEGNGR